MCKSFKKAINGFPGALLSQRYKSLMVLFCQKAFLIKNQLKDHF